MRWADNYRTAKVGGRQLVDAQVAGAVETEPGSGTRYGAGIVLDAEGSVRHDGGWAEFVTAFAISKDRRTALAVSCNTSEHKPDVVAYTLGLLWF